MSKLKNLISVSKINSPLKGKKIKGLNGIPNKIKSPVVKK